MQALPDTFRPLLWSYNFERIDPVKTIIVQSVNYGALGNNTGRPARNSPWAWYSMYAELIEEITAQF